MLAQDQSKERIPTGTQMVAHGRVVASSHQITEVQQRQPG